MLSRGAILNPVIGFRDAFLVSGIMVDLACTLEPMLSPVSNFTGCSNLSFLGTGGDVFQERIKFPNFRRYQGFQLCL